MKKLMMTLMLMPMMALATTWYVNGSSGSDYNSGTSQSSAKATIQAAIDVSAEGDTILVAPGTYGLFSSQNRRISICGTAGVNQTVIDGQEAYNTANGLLELGADFDFDYHLAIRPAITNTLIEGFVVKRLSHIRGGTLKRCIIRDNDTWSLGGAAFYYGFAENCLFLNNRGMNGAAADGCILRNCTMVGNSARDIDGVCLNSVLENCIVYGNANNERSTFQSWFDRNPLVTSVGYREKNVYVGDAGFVNAANGDYRLAAGSPCIDAGDNSYVTATTDLAGNARIVNGKVDIGCYEYGAVPVTGMWTVTQYNLNARPLSVSDAEAYLVDSSKWDGSPVTRTYQTISFEDSDIGVDETNFEAVPFPGNFDFKHGWYVVEATGRIRVNEAGYWTFACGADNGCKVTISGNGFAETFTGGNYYGYGTGVCAVNFPSAGEYEVRLLHFEDGGRAVLDFSVAKGNYSYFDTSVFKLVGDPASGVTLCDGMPATKYALTRDPNGGTYQGRTAATTVYGALADGSTAYWEIGVPTRPGHTFAGWYTAPSGGEMAYDAAGRSVAGSCWDSGRRYIRGGDLVVYARWIALPRYALTRDPNGGTYQGRTAAVTVYDVLSYGSSAYWEIGAPTRPGYTFAGWYTAPSGGEMAYGADGRCVAGSCWDSGRRYIRSGDLTVYAHWIALPRYALTRDPNGGTYQGRSSAVTVYDAIAYGSTAYWEIGVPVRADYTFAGWYTAPSGGEMAYDASGRCVAGSCWDSGKRYIRAGDLAVYARWTPKTYDLYRCQNYGGAAPVKASPQLKFGGSAWWSVGVPWRTGYTFAGWWTRPDGGEMVYGADGSCLDAYGRPCCPTYWGADKRYVHAGDLVVYARWTPKTYDLYRCQNYGGAAPVKASPQLKFGGSAWWSVGVPWRTGYTFAGWWTRPDGGEMVYGADGSCLDAYGRPCCPTYWGADKRYVHAGDLVVYAHWTERRYTLTRNPNGGTYQGRAAATVVADALTCNTGSYWSIGVPTRPGYAFFGWFTADGVKVYDTEGKCVTGDYWDSARHYRYAGDLTVYAIWVPSSSQVIQGKNGKWKVEDGELDAETLPEWAVGTFEGAVLDAEASGPAGVVTLTVAADGSVSGKMLEGGRTWTLSAPALEYAGGAYIAAITGRCGELSFTSEATFAADDMQRGVASCRATSSSPAWTAWQNIWKAEPLKAAAEQFAEAPDLVTPDGVSLRFASMGAVTAKCGAYSCSSTLIPAADGTFTCFLYFPPKGSFEGYAAEVPLAWDGAEFTLAE